LVKAVLYPSNKKLHDQKKIFAIMQSKPFWYTINSWKGWNNGQQKRGISMENTKKSEIVKGRRDMNFLAVQEFVENDMSKKMTRVEISRAIDEKLGRVGDGVSWNDTGVAISLLMKSGKLQEVKEDGKKRTFYMKVISE
jgi:hypothetical protein